MGSVGLRVRESFIGFGGFFWFRALWMFSIFVCELECDRFSKYGLGVGDR